MFILTAIALQAGIIGVRTLSASSFQADRTNRQAKQFTDGISPHVSKSPQIGQLILTFPTRVAAAVLSVVVVGLPIVSDAAGKGDID